MKKYYKVFRELSTITVWLFSIKC